MDSMGYQLHHVFVSVSTSFHLDSSYATSWLRHLAEQSLQLGETNAWNPVRERVGNPGELYVYIMIISWIIPAYSGKKNQVGEMNGEMLLFQFTWIGWVTGSVTKPLF